MYIHMCIYIYIYKRGRAHTGVRWFESRAGRLASSLLTAIRLGTYLFFDLSLNKTTLNGIGVGLLVTMFK